MDDDDAVTDGGSLAGRRILVAGASAGIGRALAVRAVRDGARVLLTARRAELLESAVAEAGGGERLAADLCRDDDCARIAATARRALGGIDVLVFCVGAAKLRMIADTTGEELRGLFDANVLSAHRLLRACLPELAPGAMAMVLSSETVGQPRTALGGYATTKAALERLVEGWRTEHPGLRFTVVKVGATFPTDFGTGFEPGLLHRALEDWSVRGLAQEEFMSPEEVADVLAEVIAAAAGRPAIGLDHLTVRSPSPVVGAFGGAISRSAAGRTAPAGSPTP
ncbi:SDR family oxidoreductase [Actinomadura rugatobispora]|uniref:SDR family oxidoreductase n=1 Tax=Actinomadura rugatobispora TaxID=1994 RepID=A0ABW1A9N6_9ACTN|nr:SDR family oxidoreductase [Actinomadura rugatobispora]